MRLMKLRRTYLYFVSAAFILLAGCESDYENRYPFDNAAYIDVAETSSDNNVTFKKTVTQLDRESPSTADVDCPELTAAQQKNFYRLIRKTDSRFISGDTDTPKK